MSFIGNTPAESYSTVVKDTFSGNDSDTDFTLSIPATTNSVEVFVENVQQEPTDAYTIAGTTLSFTAAPVTGTDNIYVIHRGPAVQQVVPPAGVAIDASTVTASSTISATGNISTEGDLKVEVSSGGIYTITGTDTASNRTLTLPDEAGTVLTSASSINGTITNVDFWVITTNTSVSSGIQVLTSNWGRFTSSSDHPASVGSAMTESSGVFTFPSTGIWLVGFKVVHLLTGGATGYVGNFIQVSEDGGSSFSNASVGWGSAPSSSYSAHFNLYPINVSDTSNIKIRFATENAQSGSMQGSPTEARTSASFIRVGDT